MAPCIQCRDTMNSYIAACKHFIPLMFAYMCVIVCIYIIIYIHTHSLVRRFIVTVSDL